MSVKVKEMKAKEIKVEEMKFEIYLKLHCSKNQIFYKDALNNIERNKENWYRGYVLMYSTNDKHYGRTKQYRVENGIFKYETAIKTANGFDHSKHEFSITTIKLTKITQGDIFDVIKYSEDKIFICLPTNLNDDIELYVPEDGDYITFNTPTEPKIVITDFNFHHKM